jgi:superfamily I DNA and/or RNA helicase
MHPVLGEFVSKQFYPPEEQFGSPRPASEFRHEFDPFGGMCAAWHDVPGEPESRDQKQSRFRRIEAREIVKLLKPMLEKAVETGLKTTFGVIAFYRAQVDEIKRELVRAGVMSEVAKDDMQLLPAYEGRVRVGTVDAFQGREFDVVFLSVVRSNTMSDSIKRYGHLMSPNRMCVAMSRQKQLLVVVGDRRILGPTARKDIPALLAFFELAVAQAKQPGSVGGAA